MGSSQSTQTTIKQTIDVITQNMTNIMVNVKNQNSSLCQTIQSQPITLKNIVGCSLNASQTANVSCNLTSMFSSTTNANLSTLINNAIDQAMTNSTKAVQEFLSTPLSSQDTNTNVDVGAYMKSLIQTNFTNNQQNTCINQATIVQGQPVVIDGYKCTDSSQSINIGQNADIINLSNCVTNTITSILTSDATINTIAQKSDTAISASQQGLGGILNNLISTLGLAWTIALIVGGVILIVALIIAMYVLLSPSGQKSLETLSTAAAKKLEQKQ